MRINLQEFALLVEIKLPLGLKSEGIYEAFEGDIRAIAKDKYGRKYKFTVNTTTDGFINLDLM